MAARAASSDAIPRSRSPLPDRCSGRLIHVDGHHLADWAKSCPERVLARVIVSCCRHRFSWPCRSPFRAELFPASPRCEQSLSTTSSRRSCRHGVRHVRAAICAAFETGEIEWIRRGITLWGSNSITRDSSRFTPGRHSSNQMQSRVCQIISSARQSSRTRYSCASQSCFNETIPRAPEYVVNHIRKG